MVPISPEAEVWTFIEEDLGKAIRLLSKADSKWYVSSDAANALAARVALFQNKMTDAANYAEAVLANSSFSLASTAMDFSKIGLQEIQVRKLYLPMLIIQEHPVL